MSLGAFGGPSNVFELSPAQGGSWSERVLYNFSEVTNGYSPTVGPILGANGTLYGTTEGGGQSGVGVVFKLTPPPRNRAGIGQKRCSTVSRREVGGSRLMVV
jgi:uncharacterized repeat protein (TIGR03803 family)